ncbi:MAG: hypothetical protein COC04_01335 [Gammaproteobacteria bacterium]|nr:MAG: hypothetical protein COC04_01335 [Gammaproteobacteria bacterium]
MKYLLTLFILFFTNIVSAEDVLLVNDSSALKWEVRSTSGKVYFRNLNEIDSSYLACCYNYYIDASTDEGKAVWSSFLSYHISGKPLRLVFSDKSTAGPLTGLGAW